MVVNYASHSRKNEIYIHESTNHMSGNIYERAHTSDYARHGLDLRLREISYLFVVFIEALR